MNLKTRVLNFLVNEDEALNSLGGGQPNQTISGTVGRACTKGLWWGPIVRLLIEVQPWFGTGHCAAVAADEARKTQ